MASDDLKRELEALRAQVEALGARPAHAAAEAMKAAESVLPPGMEDELKRGADEIVELLSSEIHDHPTAAALAAFALGVVVGRLLR
jgi:hypothetical protein